MTKGRNKNLIEARDRKMFERYYYWTEVRRLRFDDAIHIISQQEFFVSEERVMKVLRDQIRCGATVDGKAISRPLFTGFRITQNRAKGKSKPKAVELSLFPE